MHLGLTKEEHLVTPVDRYIGFLRRKLDSAQVGLRITTVRSSGYRLDCQSHSGGSMHELPADVVDSGAHYSPQSPRLGMLHVRCFFRDASADQVDRARFPGYARAVTGPRSSLTSARTRPSRQTSRTLGLRSICERVVARFVMGFLICH